MGKSTTAQLLAREDGYVYYEADCFAQLKNPYIPLDDEGSLAAATLKQKPLKGEGVKERVATAKIMHDTVSNIFQGQPYDLENLKKFIETYKETIVIKNSHFWRTIYSIFIISLSFICNRSYIPKD